MRVECLKNIGDYEKLMRDELKEKVRNYTLNEEAILIYRVGLVRTEYQRIREEFKEEKKKKRGSK